VKPSRVAVDDGDLRQAGEPVAQGPRLARIHAADGLNHAEIVKICDDAIKASILSDQPLSAKQIEYLLQERKNIYSYKEA